MSPQLDELCKDKSNHFCRTRHLACIGYLISVTNSEFQLDLCSISIALKCFMRQVRQEAQKSDRLNNSLMIRKIFKAEIIRCSKLVSMLDHERYFNTVIKYIIRGFSYKNIVKRELRKENRFFLSLVISGNTKAN